MKYEIKSPCIKMCMQDRKTNLCIGCGRSTHDISNWNTYSNYVKFKIKFNLKKPLVIKKIKFKIKYIKNLMIKNLRNFINF